MIDNQVQQIQTLGDQLSEFKTIIPVCNSVSSGAVNGCAMKPTCRALAGQELENLVASADGNYALTS